MYIPDDEYIVSAGVSSSPCLYHLERSQEREFIFFGWEKTSLKLKTYYRFLEQRGVFYVDVSFGQVGGTPPFIMAIFSKSVRSVRLAYCPPHRCRVIPWNWMRTPLPSRLSKYDMVTHTRDVEERYLPAFVGLLRKSNNISEVRRASRCIEKRAVREDKVHSSHLKEGSVVPAVARLNKNEAKEVKRPKRLPQIY